jgi:phospholipase C
MQEGYPGMKYYEPDDLPFYTWLFDHFATSDRYFHARLGPTGLNRRYLMMGQNGDPAHDPSILTRLDAAGVTWGAYGDTTAGPQIGVPTAGHNHSIDELFAALSSGTGLPSVSFVGTAHSEHPPADLHKGEQWAATLFQHIFASTAYWPSIAVLYTYDEGGGFFDHVPPALTCAPDGGNERRGFRVPLFVVSPYAKRGRVLHHAQDHRSLLRFIEARFDLPALTRADANASALLDMFDFGQTPTSVGTPPAAHHSSTCTSPH